MSVKCLCRNLLAWVGVVVLLGLASSPVRSLPSEPVPAPGKSYILRDYKQPSSRSLSIHTSLVQKQTCSNGFVMLLQNSPYNDVVAIEFLAKCGVSQEGSNLQGYTKLVLQLLQDRISNDADGQDICEITGSVVQNQATPDFARISITTTSEHAQFMLGRLVTAMSKPAFTESETSKAKGKVLQSVDAPKGAYSQLYSIFLSNFYRYHPYKRTADGVEATLARASAPEVSAFFQRYFAPNRLVCSISGKISPEGEIKLLREGFENLKAFPDNTLEVQWEPKTVEKEIYLYSQSELAWVFLGYQAPEMLSIDYAPMKVIYGVLGAGLSSRLWTELREKRGLAYEVGASYPDLVGPSHLICHIITKPASVGEARRRMIAEVERLKKEDISTSELEDTKGKLIGNYLLGRETNGGRALSVATAELCGAGYEADSRYLQELNNVTVEDVRRVAERYFQRPTLIVARPGGRFYFDW